MKPWSRSADVEGAVVMILVTAALLIYGVFNENILALRGATVPAVALLIALILGVLDLLIRSDGVRQSVETPLPVSSIVVGTLVCTVFALGLIYVGLVVSSAIGLFVSVSLVRRRLQPSVVVTSVGTALFIWVIFVYFGRAFMGDPWLF